MHSPRWYVARSAWSGGCPFALAMRSRFCIMWDASVSKGFAYVNIKGDADSEAVRTCVKTYHGTIWRGHKLRYDRCAAVDGDGWLGNTLRDMCEAVFGGGGGWRVSSIDIAKDHYLLKLNRERKAEAVRLAALPPPPPPPAPYVYRKIGLDEESSVPSSSSEDEACGDENEDVLDEAQGVDVDDSSSDECGDENGEDGERDADVSDPAFDAMDGEQHRANGSSASEGDSGDDGGGSPDNVAENDSDDDDSGDGDDDGDDDDDDDSDDDDDDDSDDDGGDGDGSDDGVSSPDKSGSFRDSLSGTASDDSSDASSAGGDVETGIAPNAGSDSGSNAAEHQCGVSGGSDEDDAAENDDTNTSDADDGDSGADLSGSNGDTGDNDGSGDGGSADNDDDDKNNDEAEYDGGRPSVDGSNGSGNNSESHGEAVTRALRVSKKRLRSEAASSVAAVDPVLRNKKQVTLAVPEPISDRFVKVNVKSWQSMLNAAAPERVAFSFLKDSTPEAAVLEQNLAVVAALSSGVPSVGGGLGGTGVVAPAVATTPSCAAAPIAGAPA